MPNARQTSLIASPSSSRATNRRRSSITEHSFHGIDTSPGKGKGVTHVSGTICHLCLGPLILLLGIGVAAAGNPTLLAETGGFLLGNAHRCGVAVKRVERAGNVIHDFIVAAARDSSEAAAADSRFAEIFLASAPPTTEPSR